MRSMIGFAVLVAAIGFSGCCGTGGKCGLSHGVGAAATATQGTVIEAGDCGCGGEVYSEPGIMQYAPDAGAAACACGGDSVASVSAPYECGCSAGNCGDQPVVAPMQFAAAPAVGGCSDGSCGASESTPARGLGSKRGLLAGANGPMGMGINDKGLACSQGRAARKAVRELKPRRSSLSEKLGFGSTEETVEEIELVSDEYVVECEGCASAVGGRHISHGVISDFRDARRQVSGSPAGCGRGGCGHSGRLCGVCNKIRGLSGLGAGSPYGGAIPHTAQQPGQSGMAPSYAYPYYTTRGPRDFLRDNPPSIGR